MVTGLLQKSKRIEFKIKMLRKLLILGILALAMKIAYADAPPAPSGCSSWTPCNDDVQTCIQVQCASGSVWLLSPTNYCCTRSSSQVCSNFQPCTDQSDINDCNYNNCNSGNGMRYSNGQIGCCQSWGTSPCATSCKDSSLVQSKSYFSITGRVVQCVKETLNLLFFSPDCHSSANLLPALQNNLKNVIYIMMVLYVVLTGIRLTISPQEFNKKEFFTFILKIVLVFYFSVGLTYKGQKQDGLVDIVYKGGLSAMESFSGFILSGAIDNGLCQYSPSDYTDGFGYLAVWDSLDCRVAYYLGMGSIFIDLAKQDQNLFENIGNNSGSMNGGTQFGNGVAFGLVQIIIPLLFGLQIVESLVIIVFCVLVLSLAVFFVQFYVICMIGLTVTTYLGVIMVPLALFGYTKQFFDNWVSVVLSYIVQPCIIIAMCALMMIAMDSIIYPECTFESVQGTSGLGWTLHTKGNSICEASLGWKLYDQLVNSSSGPVTHGWSLFFFQVTVIGNGSYWTALISAFLKLIFFSYLFLLFAEGAGDLAAQLTGGPNIGELTKGAGAVFDSFLKKMSARPNKAGGGGSGNKGGPSVSGKARQGISAKSK
jgi:type IV secretion system protein VirB6